MSLNQFGHKRSQHRFDMGGQTSPPPISKYFNKEGFRAGFGRMTYRMIAQDVIHCATRASMKQHTEDL